MTRKWQQWSWMIVVAVGCHSTAQHRPNPVVAPPLPVPAPIGPGQAPPVTPPPGQPSIPLPPGSAPGGPPTVNVPTTQEQARVQALSQRLYQANPWLKMKPLWVVQPGDTPGVAPQGDQYVVLSEGLVRSASDGQLAAIMALQLG